MRITILTYGSRGDVQPYVALGLGLQRAGYRVRLAAPEGFAGFVAAYGLDFAPLAGDPAVLSQRLVDVAGLNPLRTMQAVIEYAFPLGRQVLAQCREACADADAVLYSFLLTVAGHQIAVERGIPEIFAQLYPLFVPTGEFPALLFPRLPVFTAAANRLTHRLYTALFWGSNRLSYRILQRRYPDLPPLYGWPFDSPAPPLTLIGCSPQVIPHPADWPNHAHMTGFWLTDEGAGWTPPDDLTAFLADGPPPVYVGFGSMISRDMDTVTAIVLEALARAGQRAVLLGGWGGLGRTDLPDSILRIDAAPHDWLFPRMAAVVHHGGAGTTAAALRAGVPTVIVPFAADQAYWAGRVLALGVSPEPIPRRALTARKLAYAIRVAVEHAPMRQRAAALGARIRAEDGVARAVEIITAYLNRRD
ncbi:MAG: glycosyltransferase family 1 protein [Anaerolineae bacterium]|nr:glycosyltransferase family 1 protein [Anaerolineae bacterium]